MCAQSSPMPPAITGEALVVASSSDSKAKQSKAGQSMQSTAQSIVNRGDFAGSADPRVLNMCMYVCMCMHPHNFDRGRNVALTSTFTVGYAEGKNTCKINVQYGVFGHLIL
jgi:hypothetical protein